MIIQPIPALPWSKVGTDLFELDGNNYLVMVDYYSSTEIYYHQICLQKNIKHPQKNIARYGRMDTLISDNGPQYSSAEFDDFIKSYDIKHITTSSPGHQQTNGFAEKAVQIAKNLIKKSKSTGNDIYLALLDQRNTPRNNIGSSMQRLMGRRAKTALPITDNFRQLEQQNTKTVSSGLPTLLRQRYKRTWWHQTRRCC